FSPQGILELAAVARTDLSCPEVTAFVPLKVKLVTLTPPSSLQEAADAAMTQSSNARMRRRHDIAFRSTHKLCHFFQVLQGSTSFCGVLQGLFEFRTDRSGWSSAVRPYKEKASGRPPRDGRWPRSRIDFIR